jgi:hypothetical protein
LGVFFFVHLARNKNQKKKKTKKMSWEKKKNSSQKCLLKRAVNDIASLKPRQQTQPV